MLDQICVRVKFSSNKSLIFIVSYIPPGSNLEMYEKHLDNLIFITNIVNDCDEIILLGDFNLPNISWLHHNNSLLPHNLKSNIDIYVVSTLLSYGFIQRNAILNDNSRILDLILATNELRVSCHECLSPILNNSFHHKAIFLDVTFYSFDNTRSESSYRHDYLNGDYVMINNFCTLPIGGF